MEMNSHESRRVSEMARVSDDLLGTGGLAVHQFNSSTGLSACPQNCDLGGRGAAAVSPRRPSLAGDRDAPSCLEFNGSEQKAAK